MTADAVVLALSTLLAAIIGALISAFFRREPKGKKPRVTFDTREIEANIDSIGLNFDDDGAPNRKIVVKQFILKNVSDEAITDLIVEYKNLHRKSDRFHIENNPSQGLLESYYDVAFSEERESLRHVFTAFPAGARFVCTLTVNDFWVSGGFQANSQQAEILTASELANEQSGVASTHIARWKQIYGATVAAFVALLVVVLNLN